jgi:hypothetical protein
MTTYQKRQNEKFLIRFIYNSSIWTWTDILVSNKIENNKLKPFTKKGKEELKK